MRNQNNKMKNPRTKDFEELIYKMDLSAAGAIMLLSISLFVTTFIFHI
ncbi:MAG: hypothetical protein WCC82_03755 [Nitrososphaeraceae archaeon]|jgi:hypothetical protein